MAMLADMHCPGGKGGLYRQLINLMPPHDTYIETHLGAGAVLRNKVAAHKSIGIDIDPRVIEQWDSLDLPGTEIIEGDALVFLRGFAFTGRELVYCDPPYLPSTRRRQRIYRYDYTEACHEALLSSLVKIPTMVMISGYDSGLYGDYLSTWNRVDLRTGSHGMARNEVVWMNFQPPEVPHDKRFIGCDFREREQIRRRHSRLARKVEALRPAERALLLGWIKERFAEELEESP